jgi:hypothetical protein
MMRIFARLMARRVLSLSLMAASYFLAHLLMGSDPTPVYVGPTDSSGMFNPEAVLDNSQVIHTERNRS